MLLNLNEYDKCVMPTAAAPVAASARSDAVNLHDAAAASVADVDISKPRKPD